jgi:hypothetical protein
MSTTYSGSTLSVVASLPATYDQAGYEALTFVAGECALHDVPPLMREWATVGEPLVCKTTDVDKKGSSKWAPVPFKLSGIVADAAQAIYITLEANQSGVGSFKLALAGAETLYFTAMVSKFASVDGGSQDTVHTRSGTLLIQSAEITKVDPS